MGFFFVVLTLVAAILLYNTEHIFLMLLALLAASGTFWSFGIMHNYAVEMAKFRQNYTGSFYDFTEFEVQSVPNGITYINMVCSLLGLVLLITGIFFTWG